MSHLLGLGRELRAIRAEAGLTLVAVSRLATITAGHLGALERGRRRTRRSTLERIVAVLVPDELDREATVARLVEAAGPALAPESDFTERVARRRARRERQDRSAAIETADATAAMLRRSLASLEGDARQRREAMVASIERMAANLRAESTELPAVADRVRPTRRQRRAVERAATMGTHPDPEPSSGRARPEPTPDVAAKVPPAVVARIRTTGLDPIQRAAFERQVWSDGPNRDVCAYLVALDDERLAS
ncbi:MAG TPA: helix-turn-helix domain-containing protein [Iamia sp.]|nr:helix-turn-helix domain-containing protein [Iamia sp.]